MVSNDHDGIAQLSPTQREKALEEGMMLADKFINRNYLINLCSAPVEPVRRELKTFDGIRLFRVQKFVYDYSENVNDKLISIYSALSDRGAKAIVVIDGNPKGVDFYVGIRSDESERSQQDATTAAEILRKGIKGNFPGSVMTPLNCSDIERLLGNAVTSSSQNGIKSIASVSIIPSVRDEDKDRFVQGIEKFVDAMSGETYTAILLANPISNIVLEQRKRGFEELYSTLSSYSKVQVTFGTSESESVSRSTFENFSKALTNSIANTNSSFNSSGASSGSSSGSSYNSEGSGSSWGSNSSSTYSSGESWAKSVSQGVTESSGSGSSLGEGRDTGKNSSINLDYENKSVVGLMEKISEQLERIKACECYGLWECAGYFISQDVQTAVVASNTYKALMAGNDSGVESSFANLWTVRDKENAKLVLESLKYGLHPCLKIRGSTIYPDQEVTPTCMVSGKDLPLFMGLPQRSVPGVTALEMAPFGRNVLSYSPESKADKKVRLGNIFHMGEVESSEVSLNIESLSSHCFVCGSTGSGKSNTSYLMIERLIENGIKFLVVEPAKGEYRRAFGNLPNINIFCTNLQYYRMLKINPFKFPDKIHVLEHIDRLVEIFNACWPMHSAMPAILKNSIEQAYIENGWDLNNSARIIDVGKIFPTFEDLLEILPKVIKTSGYSQQLQSDYIGSLVTRVRSMTNGIYGQIFCDCFDTTDKELFDSNTIIDLSRVGSADTKALIMGLLVLRLSEYRMVTAVNENQPLKHVTILEEAHNLLKRTSTQQSQDSSNLQGKSVEMISQSIAEMRTYGEGFMIIDQSPTAVDISAIKNTNTKILMRLPEEEDCEAVGNSVSIDDPQKKELPRLPRGVAVVYQNEWLEAVLSKIDRCSDKYRAPDVTCTFEEIKNMRRVVLEQFKQDIDKKDFEKAVNESDRRNIYAKQQRIIDAQPINRFKKAEMKAKVESIYSQMFTSRHKDTAARARVSIASCEMVLSLVPFAPGCNYETDQEKYLKSAGVWINNMYSTISRLYVGANCDRSILRQLVIDVLLLSSSPEHKKLANVLLSNKS